MKLKIICENCKTIIKTETAYINRRVLCQRCWYREKHKFNPKEPYWYIKPVGTVK